MTAHLRVLPVAPLTRSECREWEGCSLRKCRYHLEHDDHPPLRRRGDNGNLERRITRRRELGIIETCSLNVADRAAANGGLDELEIANLMGVTYERLRTLVPRAEKAFAKKAAGLK